MRTRFIRAACVTTVALLVVFAALSSCALAEAAFTSADAWTPEWFRTNPETDPDQPWAEAELDYETVYDDSWNETGWTVFAAFTEQHGRSLQIQKIAVRWFCGGQGNVVLRDQIFDTAEAIRSTATTDTLEGYKEIPMYFQAVFPSGYEDRKKVDGIGVVLCGTDRQGKAYEFRGYLDLPQLEDAPETESESEPAAVMQEPPAEEPEATLEPGAVMPEPLEEEPEVTLEPAAVMSEPPEEEPEATSEPAAVMQEPPAEEPEATLEPGAVMPEPPEEEPEATPEPEAVMQEPPEEVPEATPLPEPILVQQGDIVFFGHDPNAGTEEPLEWLVLDADRENGKLFVISRYALGAMAFSSKAISAYSWENSIVREWLNGTLLNTAFTPEEQAAIQDTEVDLSEEQGLKGWNSAGRAAESTNDKLFLLSALEVQKYLVKDEWLLCAVPDSAEEKAYQTSAKELNGRKTCDYWLRNAAYKTNAGIVRADGKIDKESMNNGRGAVRPAMWVSIYAVYLEGE